MPECTCWYCGKKYSAPDEKSARRRVIGHLRVCPVRTGGIQFPIGSKIFTVKPMSIQCVGDLKKTAKDLEPLPPPVQEAAFMGLLLGEKRNGRVKDFSY